MGIGKPDFTGRSDGPGVPPLIKVFVGLVLLSGVASLALTQCPARSRNTKAAQETRAGKGSLRVNINIATQKELETIPEIGPARAKSIIDHRPYKSVDELTSKHVLGATIARRIERYVKVDGETEKTPPAK